MDFSQRANAGIIDREFSGLGMEDREDSELAQTILSHTDQELVRVTRGEKERVPVLIVLHGKEIGRRYLLNEEDLVLGRHPRLANLVVQGDREISSRHARLKRSGESFLLEDMGSTNGTLLNGIRLEADRDLSDGDKILAGSTVLKFTFQDTIEEDFHGRVERMMNIDELTGLMVKRSFDQQLDWALQMTCSGSDQLTVLMMDMDGLKSINDAHGHSVGAGTIASVGRLLGTIVNPLGCVTRFGGDEFTAFLSPCERSEGLDVAERIRSEVETQPIEIDGVTVSPTISIGVSSHPRDGVTPAELVRAADAALYRAKAKGRNCVSE